MVSPSALLRLSSLMIYHLFGEKSQYLDVTVTNHIIRSWRDLTGCDTIKSRSELELILNSCFQLLVIVEEPTVNVLHRIIETFRTTWKFFRPVVYTFEIPAFLLNFPLS